MNYELFEHTFKQLLHGGGDFETKCILNIKNWMFANTLSSETAFERLLTLSNRFLDKKLARPDLHKAF
jgi:hypothetical protein